jgi:FAD/FMN-containing dehydrogenase
MMGVAFPKNLSDLSSTPATLTNWSKTARSACVVCRVDSEEGVAEALSIARSEQRTLVPRGAGHSYTDAALNTGSVVLDLTPMNRILGWDPERGVLRGEAGVTLRQVVQVAARDGWWPVVSPSTPDVTLGGCVAMNVNGKNAWKCGPFGAHVQALEVLLAGGERLTLECGRDDKLLRAFIGSLGLLGIVTAVTLRLERASHVRVRQRPARCLGELLALSDEEAANSDYLEAWLDGTVTGQQLGCGHLTCARLEPEAQPREFAEAPGSAGLVARLARLARPALVAGPGGWHEQAGAGAVRLGNRAYALRQRWGCQAAQRQDLFAYTYWPAGIFSAYNVLLPEGVETFQAFVPRPQAPAVFEQVLRESQRHKGALPFWCVVKQHRRDPYLLSYQVDGFSLELNYARRRRPAGVLEPALRRMIAIVIEAGGRFYLAKDGLLTAAQYRQSVGDEAVDAFLRLKQQYDPEQLLQSDLYRRVFQPG